jgi:hypothetical protein
MRCCLLFLLLGAAGCAGTEGVNSNANGPSEADKLQQVGELYRHATNDANGKSPSCLADLDKYEQGFPDGYEFIRAGKCVVLWGATMGEGADAATTVLAYEKDVPASGGTVLMLDGSVKQLSSDEFVAAPKGLPQ